MQYLLQGHVGFLCVCLFFYYFFFFLFYLYFFFYYYYSYLIICIYWMQCNPTTAVCVSKDKRWIATADSGPDSMIVVWDSLKATPVKIIHNPYKGGQKTSHLNFECLKMFVSVANMSSSFLTKILSAHVLLLGVAAMDMSSDSMFLVTLSQGYPQQIAVWEWTVASEEPAISAKIGDHEYQVCLFVCLLFFFFFFFFFLQVYVQCLDVALVRVYLFVWR